MFSSSNLKSNLMQPCGTHQAHHRLEEAVWPHVRNCNGHLPSVISWTPSTRRDAARLPPPYEGATASGMDTCPCPFAPTFPSSAGTSLHVHIDDIRRRTWKTCSATLRLQAETASTLADQLLSQKGDPGTRLHLTPRCHWNCHRKPNRVRWQP